MKTVSKILRDVIPVTMAFLTAMLLSRFYEWAILYYQHGPEIMSYLYLGSSLISDLKVTLIAAVPLGLTYLGIKKQFPRQCNLLIAILITVLALVNGALISYFNATLTPLGPEFWVYSVKEITDTVLAADRFNYSALILWTLATAVLFGIVRKIIISVPAWQGKSILSALPLIFVLIFALFYWDLFEKGENQSGYTANKIAYFISHSVDWAGKLTGESEKDGLDGDNEFPFLHQASDKDVLGPYFRDMSSPPNIVFIIVESLGGEFVGKRGQWSGFAPFLDSLAAKSLYWENGLSLSGRTFGMMPSVFGSLPPGRNGFMELGPDYPNHLTLISMLDERGYHTSYYSGFDTYFDKLNYFLEYQEIDFLLNKQKIQSWFGDKKNISDQNYWGYDDKFMFTVASSILDTVNTFPRLEIYHTLQSHSPFTVPDQEVYREKFERIVNEIKASEEQKKAFRRYQPELTTLLYTDEAIRDFMHFYKQRDHYKNTIFVITGDHWLIPVPQTTRISRYHVPIIISSPLLKESAHFKSVNTHANILPTLASFINNNTELSLPDLVHWTALVMDTSRAFRNTHSVPLMKNKNQLTDYLGEQYYLSGNDLFELKENLGLAAVDNEEEQTRLQEKLNLFKAKNEYAVSNDKIYPGTKNKMPEKYALIVRYDTLFHRIDTTGKTVDEQFQLARKFAFNRQYGPARAIGERLLLQYPDYHDVRLLMGRTYAWEGAYEKARKHFDEVLSRDSTYTDVYNALFDTEYWDGDYRSALEVINKGLKYYPNDKSFLERKLRVLVQLDEKVQASELYRKFKKEHPEYDFPEKLKQSITD